MPNLLPVQRLIEIDISLTPLPAQAQNLSTLMVLGSSTVIDVVSRSRDYSDLDEVGLDFSSNTPEYLAAQAWFGQDPQPTSLIIARWAQTASHGQLLGGVLPASALLIATWNTIVNGGFHITIDAGSSTNITGLNFSAAANLNAVAADITAALTGATCTYDSDNERFVITSTTTGVTSAISFLTPPTAGVDISGLLEMTNTAGNGAYQANGIAAETALSAVQTMDNLLGQAWYAGFVAGAVDADHLAIAAYIEGGVNKHIYGVNTQEGGVLNPADTSNIAYLLKQLKYNKSVVHYSSSSLYAICSLLARQLTVNYDGEDTVQTLMYQDLPGILPENLNTTQANALQGNNCNVYAAYNNDESLVEYGTMASGEYVDVVTGADWFAVTLQTAIFNTMKTIRTKIPQTDPGMNILVGSMEQVCQQAVTNGLAAPGIWATGGFGTLKPNGFLPKGYYIFAPPVATQNVSNRAARKSVPFQIALKLAGAVHTVGVAVNVNQ